MVYAKLAGESDSFLRNLDLFRTPNIIRTHKHTSDIWKLNYMEFASWLVGWLVGLF